MFGSVLVITCVSCVLGSLCIDCCELNVVIDVYKSRRVV